MANLEMNYHDLNKNIIERMPALPVDEVNMKLNEAFNWMKNHNDSFFMLLGREANDYTILFNVENTPDKDSFIETITNRGPVQAFDKVDDRDTYELWIGGVFYALFPYDGGVVCI